MQNIPFDIAIFLNVRRWMYVYSKYKSTVIDFSNKFISTAHKFNSVHTFLVSFFLSFRKPVYMYTYKTANKRLHFNEKSIKSEIFYIHLFISSSLFLFLSNTNWHSVFRIWFYCLEIVWHANNNRNKSIK